MIRRFAAILLLAGACLGQTPGTKETKVAPEVLSRYVGIYAMKYDFEPGTRFSYSNIGYAILGAALSRAAGEPYVEYVPKHIFAPLGMTHSTMGWNARMATHLAKGYQVMGPRKVVMASASKWTVFPPTYDDRRIYEPDF